jgi:hypothetical protein
VLYNVFKTRLTERNISKDETDGKSVNTRPVCCAFCVKDK